MSVYMYMLLLFENGMVMGPETGEGTVIEYILIQEKSDWWCAAVKFVKICWNDMRLRVFLNPHTPNRMRTDSDTTRGLLKMKRPISYRFEYWMIQSHFASSSSHPCDVELPPELKLPLLLSLSLMSLLVWLVLIVRCLFVNINKICGILLHQLLYELCMF